jgi:DNA-binding transcriptional ArsR family regulator
MKKETFTSLADFETSLHVNLQNAKKAAKVLRAINHPLRQRILALINEKNELPVTQIYISLKVEQSVASMHLSILRGAGLVQTQRLGKQIIYSVNHNRLKEVNKYNSALVEG